MKAVVDLFHAKAQGRNGRDVLIHSAIALCVKQNCITASMTAQKYTQREALK